MTNNDLNTATDVGITQQTVKNLKKQGIKMRPWDAADSLKTNQDMALYLDACLLEGDPALVTAALGDIARAKGMSQLARDSGLGRESLYKALSADGNPEFATVMRVMNSIGLRFKTCTLTPVVS